MDLRFLSVPGHKKWSTAGCLFIGWVSACKRRVAVSESGQRFSSFLDLRRQCHFQLVTFVLVLLKSRLEDLQPLGGLERYGGAGGVIEVVAKSRSGRKPGALPPSASRVASFLVVFFMANLL
jgi:hypothetical protein